MLPSLPYDPVDGSAFRAVGGRFRRRRLWSNVIRPLLMKKQKTPREVKPKTLLLLRLDRIGDYLLFRNVLADLRNVGPYCDYHITLCGNELVRDLAETLDRGLIDDFLWIDRQRFIKDRAYQLQVNGMIYRRGFSVAVQPAFSRDLCADLLVWASQAPERIGAAGDPAAQKKRQRLVTDSFYTRLLELDPRPCFEFIRNREIMERLTGGPSTVARPHMSLPIEPAVRLPKSPYAVLVVGAGSSYKVWPGFGEAAEHLRRRGLEVAVVGRGAVVRAAVKKYLRPQRRFLHDYVDRTSLIELAFLLRNASVVAANDTGPMHMAVLLGRPTLCISGGNNAFRFNRYPAEYGFSVRFLFPPEIEAMSDEQLETYFAEYDRMADLKTISAESVCRALDEMLNEQ